MRTIEGFGEFLNTIEEIMSSKFIPTLFGQQEKFADEIRDLLSLPIREGGLGIKYVTKESARQYDA